MERKARAPYAHAQVTEEYAARSEFPAILRTMRAFGERVTTSILDAARTMAMTTTVAAVVVPVIARGIVHCSV